MPTLVLSPRYTADSIALWKSAIALHWEVTRLPNWRVTEQIDDPVIYGEPLFARAIAERLSVKLLDPDADWLATLPIDYLKRQVLCTTLAEARKITTTKFIKPAADKSFQAQIYQSGKQLPIIEALSDDTPVLVSEPVTWEIEFRCFIQKRTLRAISSYWSNGCSTERADGSWYATESEYSQAAAFCTEVINNPQVKLPDAVVVDVGKIADWGWAAIEANSVYSSGLYGCDPIAVLKVLETGTRSI